MQQMIFIADFIVCSTCFGHHYAHHQELCNKYHLLHLVGILFPLINEDARSESLQIKTQISRAVFAQ